MDTLNSYYPLYPPNPDKENLSESELEANDEYIKGLVDLNERRIRMIDLHYDDWTLYHSDDLWYFWCMCKEHTEYNILPFLNRMSYYSFCRMCYENSSKH